MGTLSALTQVRQANDAVGQVEKVAWYEGRREMGIGARVEERRWCGGKGGKELAEGTEVWEDNLVSEV
jgi:hypothetical protein